MNMKRNLIIIAFAAMLSLLTSCGKEAAPFDDSKIWDAIQDLKKRVEALERTVADNVSAIQSMVSLGSVTSWEIDAETGKGVITLVGGKKITIDQNVKGYSVGGVLKSESSLNSPLCHILDTTGLYTSSPLSSPIATAAMSIGAVELMSAISVNATDSALVSRPS